MIPFKVKKAAFNRRKSVGEMMRCSYSSRIPTAATPTQAMALSCEELQQKA